MPLTAQQICTLAAQEAKCPGFTSQSGQFLNATLQDLCMNYDLDAALGSNSFLFNSGTSVTGTVTLRLPSGLTTGTALTAIDETASIPNGTVVTKIGIYQTLAKNLTLKIAKKNGPGNYDIAVSQPFAHPGGGWADLTLLVPYSVPATGTYYIGAWVSGAGSDECTSTAGAYVLVTDVTGNGQIFTEDPAGGTWALRYTGLAATGTGTGSGPYTLPADYLRTQVKDGKDEIFYTINGVPYPLIQVTKAEYDWMVQTPGFSSYPYNYATDISQIPAQLFVWPPASGSYPVTHRYYKLMPDIVTPETSATVPWFLNTQILIRSVAGRLMGLTGDSRQAEYLGDGEKYPLGAGTLLNAYLKNVEDREGAVHTVGRDRRRWGRPFDQLKNTKNIGWALAALLFSWMWLSEAHATCVAPCTAAQINADTVTNYPDNTTGQITPSIVRGWQTNLVNSIMPTAPVGSGNLVYFNGTTGLLADSTISATTGLRTRLAADTIFWRRSDGSNTLCNGTANAAAASAPNCAYVNWNNLYTGIITKYDFGGFAVTLKSGTTDTTPTGLFMSKAWVGGGSLTIDLAGSSIAETVTKGLINDVVQPGQINVINSSGLGVGGNISSAGFACVQNDNASAMNIGAAAGINGISTGPCFDAHYEAIQDGNIYLFAPVMAIGAGGNEFVLVGAGSTFGFNGLAVNICSNQTYSLAFAAAQTGGNIQANGATFNFTPGVGVCGSAATFAVTANRYNVITNASIYTASAGATFFPGNTNANPGDSGGCYDATCYGSLASGTPVLGSLLGTGIVAPGNPSVGKASIYVDSTALTLQTKNSFGAIATMVFTQAATNDFYVTGLSAIGGLSTAKPLSCPNGCTFQSNGTTTGGVLTTGQKWGFGTTTGAQTPTNTAVVISTNITAVDAATPGLTPLLHVAGADSALGAIIFDGFGQGAGLGFRRANGTAASPTVVTSGALLGSFFGLGYDASGSKYGYSGEIDFFSSETWSNTAHGGGIKFWSVANTTTTQVNSMTLFNSGGLSVGSTVDPTVGVINALNGFSSGGTIGVTCGAGLSGTSRTIKGIVTTC